MRLLPLLLALVLGGATAFLVSCGGDRSHLIPSTDASDLNSALSQVASATKSGDCSAAGQALSRAQGVLLKLPSSVDSRLKNRLEDGIASLRKHVPSQCAKPTTTETQSTTTEAPPVTTTETTQTETTQTETTPTDTTTTETGTTSTPTTTTPTTTTNTTGGTG